MSEGLLRSASDTSEDSSSSNSSDAESEATVELLVTGRAKRATAGTRISSLIQQEKDELVDLVFEKEEGDVDSEEDVDFLGDEDEAASDAQLDSSSDDEDQGTGKADDFEGEKELQKQVRLERQKKRKAQAVFKTPAAVRKKVKVDPTAAANSARPTTPAPRPKKKSERVSWIPTPDEGPVRSSSRKQTMQNKETIHQRMAEKEKQRIKQMKHMEEAEKRRQAAKAPPMTQAERMAEAARTERKNAKSLSRWEESEREKAEAQRAKLEALHNRQLTGPVITWWSGLTRWVNGKLSQVGIREIKATEEPTGLHGKTSDSPNLPDAQSGPDMSTKVPESNAIVQIDQGQPEPLPPEQPVPKFTFAPPMGPGGLLDGIHYYASLPMSGQATTATSPNHYHEADLQDKAPSAQPSRSMSPVPIEHPAAFVEKPAAALRPDHSFPYQYEQPKPTVEYLSRNLVALRNIENNAHSIPELAQSVLVKRRNPKLQKPNQEVCAITGFPARFRDPKTGLAYSDAYAYREIQRLRKGGSRWSNLLGCYVGSTTAAAHGVPERFRKV
ncbi:MAG: hypothetical protein Q9191_002104 [Dirinaria sp. TL-2023a]